MFLSKCVHARVCVCESLWMNLWSRVYIILKLSLPASIKNCRLLYCSIVKHDINRKTTGPLAKFTSTCALTCWPKVFAFEHVPGSSRPAFKAPECACLLLDRKSKKEMGIESERVFKISTWTGKKTNFSKDRFLFSFDRSEAKTELSLTLATAATTATCTEPCRLRVCPRGASAQIRHLS